MIKVEKLYKKFGKDTVLKNVSFEAARRDITVILGPSGSGKSTLLRCIKRLEEPTSGKIYFNDTEIKNAQDKALNKIGLVFQNFNLFPHLTAIENLTYAPSVTNSQGAIHDKATKLLEQFSLSNKAKTRPKDLSGGQKQRVAIARALMQDPEILLFDEPTSALDQESTSGLVKIIEKLKSETTILIVTHELKFAKALADKIIFMDHGQILCNQDAAAFFQEPDSHRARLFIENYA